MRALIGLLLCLLALGCAEARQEPGLEAQTPIQEPLTLRVSTNLDPALQASVAAAAADWQAAGFDFAVELDAPLGANLIAGSCADLAGGGQVAPGCTRPSELGPYIQLDVDALAACRWVRVGGATQCLKLEAVDVIRHEIGHWLGLGYHLPEGNVMQAHYDAGGDYPKALTALDVEATSAAMAH